MRTRSKITITICVVVCLLVILIAVNQPLVVTGATYLQCNFDGCSTHTVYESYIDYWFPCEFQLCTHSVETISLASATLFSGTGTSPSQEGTARIEMTFTNPGSQTKIISLQIKSASASSTILFYQCQTETSCSSPTQLTLTAGSDTAFDSPSTIFYLSQNITSGVSYNYIFNFANGQSLSGALVAK